MVYGAWGLEGRWWEGRGRGVAGKGLSERTKGG